MSIDERELKLKGTYRRHTNRDLPDAVLGTAAGLIPDANHPGFVWVRESTSNGLSEPKSVLLPSNSPVILKPGASVKLGWDDRDQQIVLPGATTATLAGGTSTVATSQQQQSPSSPQAYLETLRLVAKGGMLVSLKGWNIIGNGTYYEFKFPDIDLTGSVPSAGEMCYATIFVLSSLDDVEVVSSTPVLTSDLPLGKTDVQECLDAASPGSTATWAVKLIGGQTEILQTQLDDPLSTKDLRQVVNAKGIYEYTPANTADTAGLTGDVSWDDDYIYVKTGAGWKRSALSAF